MGIYNLDVRQLIVFHFVAREENTSIAADKLCLTQPTVTYHLKALERNIGKKLLISKNHRMHMTAVGKDLFECTRELVSSLDRIDRYLDELREKRVCIGVSPMLQGFVASIMASLCKKYQGVNFEVNGAVSIQIIKDVSESKLDMGIVLTTNYTDYKVKATRVSDDEKLVMIASPKLVPDYKSRVEWTDLKDYPVVCGPKGSFLNQLLMEKFNRIGIKPRFILDTINPEYMKKFIEEGNGITAWFKKDIESEIETGKLVYIPLDDEISVSVDIIVNQDTTMIQPVVKQLINDLKGELGKP